MRKPRTYLYVLFSTSILFIILLIIPRGSSTGSFNAYDKPGDDRINRHDIVYAYGWPMVSAEYWKTHWYGVKRTNVRVPASQKDWHEKTELDSLQNALAMGPIEEVRRHIQQRIEILSKIPHGNGWVFYWPFAAVNLVSAFVLSMVGMLAHAAIWRIYSNTRAARASRGLCGSCGYDLRGSTGSRRCPECGTKFEADLVSSQPDNE